MTDNNDTLTEQSTTNNKTIPSELCLSKIMGVKEFVQCPKCLLHAEEYISRFGEVLPLKTSLKLQYGYMYNQFKGFEKQFKPYYESQQSVADKLGYSLNTVKSNIADLKEMGLLQVERVGYNKYQMRVIGIEWLQGILYNKSIKPREEKKKFKYSYDEYKIVKKNYDQFEKVRNDLTTEYISIPKNDYLDLLKRKQ